MILILKIILNNQQVSGRGTRLRHPTPTRCGCPGGFQEAGCSGLSKASIRAQSFSPAYLGEQRDGLGIAAGEHGQPLLETPRRVARRQLRRACSRSPATAATARPSIGTTSSPARATAICRARSRRETRPRPSMMSSAPLISRQRRQSSTLQISPLANTGTATTSCTRATHSQCAGGL